MKCPYYRKACGEDHPFGLKSYCEGDTRAGLRVPSVFEETHYCTTQQYPACRVFQARQSSIRHTEAPTTLQERRRVRSSWLR
jgi:hypothetical protein